MRPSFLLNPQAFTRGEGVGSPTALPGAWPCDLLCAVQQGAQIFPFDTVTVLNAAPRAALLSGRLNGERLDRFLAGTAPSPSNGPAPGRSWGHIS